MITSQQLALCGSEDGHQKAIMNMIATSGVPELQLAFHIPNGGSRNKAEAGKLKAMGVKAGVPDIFLPVARGPYHGLFVELKRPADLTKSVGTVSTKQEAWLRALQEQGYYVAVCYGWEEAYEKMLWYLQNEH
jgi:hypothetical protein